MVAETLAQVHGHSVINRAAVGVVRVHITKGNAAGEIVCRITGHTESVALKNLGCERHAWCKHVHQRWVEAGRPEEVDQRCWNILLPSWTATRKEYGRVLSPDKE